MNYDKLYEQAAKMAAKAKPGAMKLNGNIYTFVFEMETWTYAVYENGFLLHHYNTKSLKTAKKWLKEYFNN